MVTNLEQLAYDFVTCQTKGEITSSCLMEMAHCDVIIGGAIIPVAYQKSQQAGPSLRHLARKLHV
jgi:NADH:ubiquinone oxidoreductase subunit K